MREREASGRVVVQGVAVFGDMVRRANPGGEKRRGRYFLESRLLFEGGEEGKQGEERRVRFRWFFLGEFLE